MPVHTFADNFNIFSFESFTQEYDLKGAHTTSVPRYSPFRYPGGKSWLAPQISQWLRNYDYDSLLEPFAGGASVSLFALGDGLVDNIHINEIDPRIFNFWYVVLNRHIDLVERIYTFENNGRGESHQIKNFLDHNRTGEIGSVEWAFATLLRNRLSRNGVTTVKSGLLKKGDRGLYSRWYPATLAERIKWIGERKYAIHLTCEDGVSLIKNRKRVAVFIDPPYRVAGQSLYTFNEVDHAEILKRSASLGQSGLVTYDANLHIAALIKKYGLNLSRIAMMGGMNSKKVEFLISRDLSWLRS